MAALERDGRPVSPRAEIWAWIEGYEGLYAVSTEGRVRSHWGRHGRPTTILRQGWSGQRRAYALVSLVSAEGRRRSHLVHTLVLVTFVGPAPSGMECSHENGDSRDNRLENLSWATPTENNRKKVQHGTQQRGAAVPGARLSEEAVRSIRRSRESQSVIARRYGVSRWTIRDVIARKTWRHVQ